VGPAGARYEVDTGALRGALDDAPLGDRRLAVCWIVDLTRAIVEIDAEGEIDDAVIACDDAVEPCRVALVDLAAGKGAL